MSSKCAMSGATSNPPPRAWLTPDNAPTQVKCRRVLIPDSEAWIAIVTGALVPLIYAENWEQFGALTAEQAAQRAQEMFLQFLADDEMSMCMIGTIQAYVTVNPPLNCLPCDGTLYAKALYPDLYARLDPQFIVDANTFYVPDMRGMILAGTGNLDEHPEYPTDLTVGLSTGRNYLEFEDASILPPHTHDIQPHSHTSPPHNHGIYAGVDLVRRGATDVVNLYVESFLPIKETTQTAVTIDSANVTAESTGQSTPFTTIPRVIGVNYCIVAR